MFFLGRFAGRAREPPIMKSIYITDEAHAALKIAAVKAGENLGDYVDSKVREITNLKPAKKTAKTKGTK